MTSLKEEMKSIIGQSVDSIDTPALIVDIDIMNANIIRMNENLSGTGVGVRPHAKTHKTPQIAHIQMDMGAIGITCAKVGEAEELAKGGIDDILIANQVVGDQKIARAVELSRRISLKAAVDSRENALELSKLSYALGGNLGIVVEVDIGNNRAGVRDLLQVVELVRLVTELPGLTFCGIMGYEGHCIFIQDMKEREIASNKAYDILLGARDMLTEAGFPPEIVSCAGTGTSILAAGRRGITDIQPGSYIFMDTSYALDQGLNFEQSLTVLATVMSKSEGIWICDAGMKSMSKEFGNAGILPSYGLDVYSMSEEHVKLVRSNDADKPIPPHLIILDTLYARNAPKPLEAGNKIHLIPSHCCTTVNLHDRLYVVSNGIVRDIWPITGRGRFD